ncbi:histidine kinase [Sulfurifustis variabilis]|uniref:histidine kinase n=1 Tax=Sulfurifustis variabilis TaxID=1675686 RepID=A0A1B4V056_9GAMM|nr:sensor histidine kinase [Sulfurifustis variabilis]BAU46808.1 histidine kinase [Sulfurifustis variabilis]
MTTLKTRLGLGLAASLLLMFVLQWLAVAGALRHLAEGHLRARLEHDVEAVLAGLKPGPDGRFVLDPARLGPIYAQPFSGHYYRVGAPGQVLRSRSLWDEDLAVPAPAPGETVLRRAAGPQDQSLLVLARGYEIDGRVITVAVTEDLGPLERELARFRVAYAVISAVALAVLLLVQGGIVELTLRPLRRTREDVGRLERGEIDALDDRVPGELVPLVRELNRLLAALRARLVRSRQALGNMAHALKTPLTLLTDLADHPAVRASPEARQTLTAQTAALGRLVERELSYARLAGPGAGTRSVDLATELPALVGVLRLLHRERTLDIETVLPERTRLAVDREDLLELLGNLLDNACKWAASRVRIEVGRDHAASAVGRGKAALRITVEDDGPGLPEVEATAALERGTRLDESVPGHGLGLAIVRGIVESYAGALTLDRSPLGGLRVRVELPAV